MTVHGADPTRSVRFVHLAPDVHPVAGVVDLDGPVPRGLSNSDLVFRFCFKKRVPRHASQLGGLTEFIFRAAFCREQREVLWLLPDVQRDQRGASQQSLEKVRLRLAS